MGDCWHMPAEELQASGTGLKALKHAEATWCDDGVDPVVQGEKANALVSSVSIRMTRCCVSRVHCECHVRTYFQNGAYIGVEGRWYIKFCWYNTNSLYLEFLELPSQEMA